jgi:hypothetical protein
VPFVGVGKKTIKLVAKVDNTSPGLSRPWAGSAKIRFFFLPWNPIFYAPGTIPERRGREKRKGQKQWIIEWLVHLENPASLSVLGNSWGSFLETWAFPKSHMYLTI